MVHYSNLIKFFFGKYRPIKIKGDSMKPTFIDGQIVWVDYSNRSLEKIKKNDIILFKNPEGNNLIVKRVAKINPEKGFWMKGDNSYPLESTDSEKFGYVKKELLRGVISSKKANLK